MKKILLASFILIVLSIGAVSASENITQENITSTECGDISLTDSSDISSDDSYLDNDFYITVKENYSQDKIDWNSSDLVYISSASQKNGTFEIDVDDAPRQSFNITDGYFSIETDGYGGTYKNYVKFIYPTDLGLDCGTYNIKVKFNGDVLINHPVNIKEKEDFDIWLQNPYYVESDYWTSPSFIIIDSNHLCNGTLEIFVNGTRKIAYDVNNGNFEEIADCSNKSRYIAAADLLSTYGKYDIQINFTENGKTRTLKEDVVFVAEYEPTANPKLDAYLDLYYVNLPADNVAHIYLPRESTGKLTVSYNDVKNENIIYSKGYGSYHVPAWNLNHLGENTLTFTYVGDDFGTLKTTVSCIVVPTVTAPSYVSVGEKFKMAIRTHEWVNGNFNVYDFSGDKKGKLLVSGIINGGVSAVDLSSTKFGLNKFYLEFDYPGGYYPVIQEVYVVKNSENISVDVPSQVNVGSDVVVNITAPAVSYNFAYIVVDGMNKGFYSMENGSVVETLSGLSKGIHKISIQYNGGHYTDGYLVGDVYSNTFTVTVGIKTNIIAPELSTVFNVAKYLVITLKDNANNVLCDKTISIKLNGITYKKITDKNGQVKLKINLPAKSYSANINFAGDDNYIGSSGNVKIVVLKATPKIIAKSKTFKLKSKSKKVTATLKDNKGRLMKKVKLTLRIKNKKYTVKTNKKGVATFKIKLAKKGGYIGKITLKSSSNYNAATKKLKIKIK